MPEGMKAYFPGPTYTSPTAAQGKRDERDDFIYSSIVVCDGGQSSQNAFTATIGQAIPTLKGAVITLNQAHHQTHSERTTNLQQAGQTGSEIGEAVVRAIGVNVEQAVYLGTGSGAQETFSNVSDYGFTQEMLAEFLNKVSMSFNVGPKKMIRGPVELFPSIGGLNGALSNTVNNSVLAIAQNGNIGVGGKKLKIGIGLARTDTISATFTVANGATINVTGKGSSYGQESLVTVVLAALVFGDVR